MLRRRTARNAVTRPTIGHNEGGRSEDKRGTDSRHCVITKQVQPILYVYNIGGLWSVIFINTVTATGMTQQWQCECGNWRCKNNKLALLSSEAQLCLPDVC